MPTNNAGSLADEMERLRSGNESFLPELGKMNSRAAFMDKHFDTILNALRASPSVDQGVVQEDREAAADVWRDMIAKPGECIAEKQIRAGGAMDTMPLTQAFARHRHRFASPQTVGGAGELVERLRKPDFWSAHFHGGGRLSDDDDCAPFQAANTIASLTAERDAALARCERLEGARAIDMAAMIYAAEEFDEDRDETPESWFGHCRRNIAEGMTAEHFGDCTKQCQTCSRCLSDYYLGRARAALGEGGGR
jgi:hypothetical protein